MGASDNLDSEADRRRSARARVNDEYATIESAVGEWVTDISHTGLFLKTTAVIPIGTRVNLKFSVLYDDIEVIEGTGEVVRFGTDERPGLGIRFVSLTTTSRDALERLLGPQS